MAVPAAALAACWLFASGQAGAAELRAIYRIDDTPGEIHLSDRPDAAPGAVSTRLCDEPPSIAPDPRPKRQPPARSSRFDDIVLAAARAQRLDPELLHAVIGVESGYLPRAVSPRGASGLMQLMPRTAQDYGVTDIFDPRQNVDAGARHLRRLLDRYAQDVGRALAAYNAGAAALDRHAALHATLSAETAAYVPLVLDRYAAARPRDAAAPIVASP